MKAQSARRPVERWTWLALFGWAAGTQLLAWSAAHAPDRLLSATGLLMLGLHAFRHPLVLTVPLWAQLRAPRTAGGQVDLLGATGAALAVAGALWRWSAG